MNPHDSAVTVDCYKRASTLGQPVDSVIERVRDYEQRGVIAGYTIQGWPDQISLTEDSGAASLRDQYETFQAWADEHGVSLAPAFTRRERTSLVRDTPETVLVLPVLCFGIRIDGTLASVVPHCTGTETYTVAAALDDIERYGRPKLSMATPSSSSAAD